MASAKNVSKTPSIDFVSIQRSLITNKDEVQAFGSEEQLCSTTNMNEPIFQSISPILSQSSLPNNNKIKSKNEKSSMRTTKNSNSLASRKQQDYGNNSWCPCLTPKQETILKIIIASLVIICIISAGVFVPLVLLVFLQTTASPTTTSTTTVSPCFSATCIGKETPYHTSMVTALFPFDGNATDLTGSQVGIPYGSPTYVVNAYVGSQALFLNNPGPNQYIEIPNIDLAQKSFTLQTWLYLTGTSLANDFGIYSQCDFNSTCLSISLRNGRFTLSFDSMNVTNSTITGTTLVSLKEWIHLSVVYDAVQYQQLIYVNGRIDSVSNGVVAPYRRISANYTTTIGRSKSFAYDISYFQGRIDHFTISVGSTRTACQIYNDATLTAYFPFNTIDPFNDYGVNLFNGIASNTTLISGGRIGQAIYFSLNTSCFQVKCFPVIRNLTNANPPFTFSLWLNPSTSTNGGSIIHISNLPYGNGSLCYDLLALTSTGALVLQLMQPTLVVAGLQGPALSANTWTHVAIIYSQEDGIRLFINGQLSITSIITSNPLYMARWDFPLYITLGNNNLVGPSAGVTCAVGSISFISGLYTGAIDDFRLYNRELDSQELCALANM